jgi:hypothetical protein
MDNNFIGTTCLILAGIFGILTLIDILLGGPGKRHKAKALAANSTDQPAPTLKPSRESQAKLLREARVKRKRKRSKNRKKRSTGALPKKTA